MRDLSTTQRATIVCLALLFSACSRDQPMAPAAPTAPTAPTTFTVSGVITDGVSGRPIPGAYLAIVPDHFPASGSWSWAFPRVSADATGHYKISDVPVPGWTGMALVQASKDGYMQQCVARATIRSDTSLNIALTPLANLAVEPSAATAATAGSRTVSGVVFEVTAEGRQPIEGAYVGWETPMDFVVAGTRSDPAGRYLLCGLPEGRIDNIFAFARTSGYNGSFVSVDPGTNTVIDIEIKRK